MLTVKGLRNGLVMALVLWLMIAGIVYAGFSLTKKDANTITKQVEAVRPAPIDLDYSQMTVAIGRITRQITEAEQRVTELKAEKVAMENAKKTIVEKVVEPTEGGDL